MSNEPNRKQEATPSPRKLRSLARLQGLSVKLSDGRDYRLQEHIIQGVTLEQVRQELANIRASLAEAVIDERAR